MDRSSLIDIVKRNEPITEEAPNTSTDRSTRHSPGRTLRGYCTFAPARDRPRPLAQVSRRPHGPFSQISTLAQQTQAWKPRLFPDHQAFFRAVRVSVPEVPSLPSLEMQASARPARLPSRTGTSPACVVSL